jgi:hypothetical protein
MKKSLAITREEKQQAEALITLAMEVVDKHGVAPPEEFAGLLQALMDSIERASHTVIASAMLSIAFAHSRLEREMDGELFH